MTWKIPRSSHAFFRFIWNNFCNSSHGCKISKYKIKWDLFQVYKGGSTLSKLTMIYHSKKLKYSDHTVILINAQKKLWQNSISVLIKTLHKLIIEGMYLNTVKHTCDRPQLASFSMVKTGFPLRSETRPGCPLFPLLFSIILEVLTRAIRHPNQKGRWKSASICRLHDMIVRKPSRFHQKKLEVIN